MLDGTLRPTGRCRANGCSRCASASARGSIRDGAASLETIGLLETRHGQGTFPRELDVTASSRRWRRSSPTAAISATSLLDVRRMFEPAVARVAATRVTDEDLADLQRILDTQRPQAESGGFRHHRGHGVSRRARARDAQSRRHAHHADAQRSAD